MKNNRTTTASTNVEYVVTASYEWSVPSKITFTDTIAEVEANADTGDTQKVKVTKNIIPNKKKLQITVSSTTTKEEGGVTKFAIKTDEDAYLIYVIKKGTTYDDEIAVGGEVMSVDSGKYAADGLIIATATGSTAYSLSAGGPLVMPELDVSVITPVCAHSLTNRALVIPMSETIELRPIPGSEEMLLSADGENVIEVPNDTSVHIAKSPYEMKFVRLTRRDYYQTWQQKLMRNL